MGGSGKEAIERNSRSMGRKPIATGFRPILRSCFHRATETLWLAPESTGELAISLEELGSSLRELANLPKELPNSLEELGNSGKELGNSLGELGSSFNGLGSFRRILGLWNSLNPSEATA